jgi:enamine deaminase RidA (YjgF/YER057c/UK114 family)
MLDTGQGAVETMKGTTLRRAISMTPVQHLNPEGMAHNPAFSQAISVSGLNRTIYIGGQNAVDAGGNIVGRGDIAAQTRQIFANLKLALAAGGASLHDIVKWNVYVVQGQALEPGFAVFQEEWGQQAKPPVISGIFVAGLAHPDFLVEIEAVAVVPE